MPQLRAGPRGGAARRAAGASRPDHAQPRRPRAHDQRARHHRARRRPTQHGYVITLDDITDLVAAQRTTAWADVARRIAHEIKNPLTPIQLSAERLKRKFGKHHRRRPRGLRPVHRHHHPPGRRHRPHGGRVLVLRAHAEAGHGAAATCASRSARRCSCMQRRASRTSTSRSTCRTTPLIGRFDAAPDGAGADQPGQERHRGDRSGAGGRARAGARSTVSAGVEDGADRRRFIDNGIGLPQENRQRLLEPYMTTREKGTGLGLAIVAQDHRGAWRADRASRCADGCQTAAAAPASASCCRASTDRRGDGRCASRRRRRASASEHDRRKRLTWRPTF